MIDKKFLNIITAQIPLLIMSINNGNDIHNLLPIMIIPVIIYFIEMIPRVIKFFWNNRKIPKNYVKYHINDKADNNKRNWHIDFLEDLSVFLGSFNSASIKQGTVTNYYRLGVNPNILFRCFRAIISPDDGYFCKFLFLEKNGTDTIIDEIKKTGFPFPDDINIEKLLNHPIYISLDEISEEVTVNENHEKHQKKVKSNVVTISAIDIKTAEDFIYIIINYARYKSNNIINFKLSKMVYYFDMKEDFREITSTVNVCKKYDNVFLTKQNYELVIDRITEWNQNKIADLNLGIPNKLGLFLIGEPGCGKSSLIYAIAAETKKHIISINLQDFTNKSFLITMASIDNKIVVFDDIDAHAFTHKRNLIGVEKKNNNVDILEHILSSKKSDDKSDILFGDFRKEMTLDVLLEVLDGYNYLNNCIVVITSNNPEKLDSAITRPGRIDRVITFKKCDEYQFNNIFTYFTGANYKEIDDKFIFSEHRYTTSAIINSFVLPHKKNPSKILQLINDDFSEVI